MATDFGVFPSSPPIGRPPKWEKWQVINAILYVNRTGCHWRMLPVNFPAWRTVYFSYWSWQRDRLWQRINNVLVKKVCKKAGRQEQPSAAVLVSQRIKTSEGGEKRGVDVHKQTPGRKRPLGVDVLGLVLLVVVLSASIQDGAGGLLTLQKLFDHSKHNLHNRWCHLKLIWADGGYPAIIEVVRQRFGWTLQIVKHSDEVKGFQVPPHHWGVERTFEWLGRYRRLARDCEHTTLSSESMVSITSTRWMLKILAT